MRDTRWSTIGLVAAAALLAAAGVLTWGGPAAEAGNEPAAEDRAAARGKGGAVWGAGYFPNVPLVTHDGRTVRFFDDLIAGRVVAINFIYTTCPDACPMETARMMEVHRLLGDRVGEDVFFYSITIDPERDTPAVLRRYVADWGVGAGWTFLTGREEDITLLRRKLGVYSDVDPGTDELDHNLSLVIGNQATGRWMKRSPYENPYVLANQLGSWLHNWKLPGAGGRDFADAPEIRQISTGENLFRTRCAACHGARPVTSTSRSGTPAAARMAAVHRASVNSSSASPFSGCHGAWKSQCSRLSTGSSAPAPRGSVR